MVIAAPIIDSDTDSDTENLGKRGFCGIFPRIGFAGPSSPAIADSDTESGGKIGFCRIFPRIGFAGPSSPAITGSDTESRGMAVKMVIRLDRDSDQVNKKALLISLARYPGVQEICLDAQAGKCTLIGYCIDPIQVIRILRKKICFEQFLSIASATRNDSFPETARITELQEHSENQQEDQTPPRQANSLTSQVEALPASRPLPPLSLPLASDAQPSSSPVSRPSQGTSNQTQAAADHVPELSFPFAPSCSRAFQTESLADLPAQSSICGGACLPKAKNLMEEKGLGGHDQLYDSAVHHLLLGIDGMAELKRRYDLHAGEQASRLGEAAMLREQVEELEAKVAMANRLELCLREMLSISEDRHAGTKTELALMQEKLDEANRRVDYLENERAERKACRARYRTVR